MKYMYIFIKYIHIFIKCTFPEHDLRTWYCHSNVDCWIGAYCSTHTVTHVCVKWELSRLEQHSNPYLFPFEG